MKIIYQYFIDTIPRNLPEEQLSALGEKFLINILNSSPLFFKFKIDKIVVFQASIKKAHQQHWSLRNDRPICYLEPTYLLCIYHLHESASDCSVQYTETALMKVTNDLLFWPGLCISPCFLWLKWSLWCSWSLYPFGLLAPLLLSAAYVANTWPYKSFLYTVFRLKCRIFSVLLCKKFPFSYMHIFVLYSILWHRNEDGIQHHIKQHYTKAW